MLFILVSSPFNTHSINRRCIIILYWLLLTITVNAQQLSAHLYNISDGLPTSSVVNVYEDHLGYLWIGTTNGLSRFDGRQFVNYDLSDGLPSLITTVTLEDNQHRLWVGTSKGMARMVGKRFIVYPVSDSMEINYVLSIIETRNRDGMGYNQ